ncbi:MAG: ATP phosphoribosyltransferase regulatory subunit [Ruminococcaceae bacterium]|nr:ATP phosphoribosyltransferase regulatory subunit [Oscillospiraceae bacterium]
MFSNNITTPEGTRDRLFNESRALRKTEAAFIGVFQEYGYSEIITPEVEYYNMFVQTGNPLPEDSMVKITDKSGRILVMRPDNTTPIARVAATRLKGVGVQRLYYNQTVFRSSSAHHGAESEIPQCGVELIGAGGLEADAEMLELAVKSLGSVAGDSFHIEIGHAGLFRAVAEELDASERSIERIRRYIERKKFAALNDYLAKYEDQTAAVALGRLSHLFGGVEVLDEADKIVTAPKAKDALRYLHKLYEILSQKGLGEFIHFDLGMVNQIDYYTGVVFRGYVKGAAASVLSGGRYDNLLGCFGADAPATGFAINTSDVEQCLKADNKSDRNRLRIAITKGRLLDKSVDMMEKMGLDCEEVRNPGRKLIAGINNYDLDVVMSKAPDVITYVEHGVCDMGIVGKDTILEGDGSFYEVLNLGFGKCRFMLAVKEGFDFYGSYKSRTVASKYPNVAKRYFAEKGMDVSVIKIEGSVELAPILNLTDGIVDIVETGSTLKANGLVQVEKLHDVSARLIVNTASMKLYKEQILDFIQRCEDVINAGN